MTTIPCLCTEELRAYLYGEIAEPQLSAVEEHLEHCAGCEAEAARIEQLSDPMLGSLRRALHLLPTEGEPVAADTLHDGPGSGLLSDDELRNATQIGSNYEILGELGRGGMSVVYKARQRRPTRIVALKMILAGAHAGPDHRTRFLAEADAIARLQHAGIVSVFEVGIIDETLFFSMELMEGGSLDDKINATPQAPRYAADLVATVARAAQFAHERGIVHRDLKPANILLTRGGAPRIADFGLARLEEPMLGDDGSARESAPSSPPRVLTVTGAILGTPSYMAPEQADGRRAAIGPCTDIYALGAILYEMLTGRPPFRGTGVLETLEMVRSGDPVPPIQLQPRIPRDLDTICLKCLAREPGRRYGSAGELADDLERFQNGQPIRARPVPVWEKVWKGARRHPTASVSALLAVVATIGLLTTWTMFTVRLRAALNQSHRNAVEADNQRVRAEDNQDRAFEGIDRFLTRIADKELASIPGMHVMRRDLLKEALEVSQGFLGGDEGGSARVRLEVARAHERCAKIYDALTDNAKQIDHFEQAVRLQRGLVKDYPDELSYRSELAKHLHNLAKTLFKSRVSDYAQKSDAIMTEALALRRELVERAPDNVEHRSALAGSYLTLGALRRAQPGRIGDAEAAYKDGLAIAEGLQGESEPKHKYQQQLAQIFIGWGALHHSLGQKEQARQKWERARTTYQEIARKDPENVDAQTGLAVTSNNLGVIYLALDQSAPAVGAALDAVRAGEQLVRIHRSVPSYRAGLAGSHNNLARVYERYGPARLAEEQLRTACAISRDLVKDHPTVRDYTHSLGKHLTNLAIFLTTQNKKPEATALCREAVELMEPMARNNASDPAVAVSLAQARFSLGQLLNSATGTNGESMALYDAVITRLDAMLGGTPGHEEARECLREARQAKVRALYRAGSYHEVMTTLEKPGGAAWSSEPSMKRLLAMSLTATGDWRRASGVIRADDIIKHAEKSPVEKLRLACVETQIAEAINADKDPSVAQLAVSQKEGEVRAIEHVRDFALKAEALPADFESWPLARREDVDWVLFRPIIQSPRFAFILASGYALAANKSKAKADTLDLFAMDALRLALARGYFCQYERLQCLKTAATFERLRGLPAFRTFLEQVEKESSLKTKKQVTAGGKQR